MNPIVFYIDWILPWFPVRVPGVDMMLVTEMSVAQEVRLDV